MEAAQLLLQWRGTAAQSEPASKRWELLSSALGATHAGNRQRIFFDKVIEQLTKKLEERNAKQRNAATRIASLARAKRARQTATRLKQLKQKERAATTVQRGYARRSRIVKKRNAATKIASVIRAKQARLQLQRLKTEETKLQTELQTNLANILQRVTRARTKKRQQALQQQLKKNRQEQEQTEKISAANEIADDPFLASFKYAKDYTDKTCILKLKAQDTNEANFDKFVTQAVTFFIEKEHSKSNAA